MLTFKSFEDVDRWLLPQHPGYDLIKELCHHFMVGDPGDDLIYDPEDDGYLILLEDSDMRKPLTEIWPGTDHTLTEVPWESWTEMEHFYVGVYLANNQYGLVFVVDKLVPNVELEQVIKSHL